MTEGNEHQRQRWSPYGRRGAAGTMGADAILVGGWIDNPAHATRYVDLCAAYRALAQEGMADRLFDAGTADLGASLARQPQVEHMAGVRMTFSDRGTTVTLGEDEPPAPGKRHVEQLYTVLTLRKGSDPARTMRVPADIAFLGDQSEDGFVLARSSRITPEQATDAVMDIFGAEIELETAANGEEEPGRPRDTIEEEAVRILEDEDAATLRRIHNITRRRIKPIMPAERGVWIEVDADGHIQARFR
ncbi:MAG: hypothetical protein OXG04_18675 [Acidobacteria bacterium]|nr:hypothetical protein [Acidobacteriota bacterium]